MKWVGIKSPSTRVPALATGLIRVGKKVWKLHHFPILSCRGGRFPSGWCRDIHQATRTCPYKTRDIIRRRRILTESSLSPLTSPSSSSSLSSVFLLLWNRHPRHCEEIPTVPFLRYIYKVLDSPDLLGCPQVVRNSFWQGQECGCFLAHSRSWSNFHCERGD